MARRKKKPRFSIKKLFGALGALALALVILIPLNAATGERLPLPSAQSVSTLLDRLYVETGVAAMPAAVDGALSVHYIDVGQADCALIRTPTQTVLIDAGVSKNSDKLVDYLKAQGIRRIDLLIATHPHADHIGGMAAVVDAFEIGKVIFSEVPKALIPTTKTYEKLLDTIAAKGLKLTKARPEMVYDIGGNASLTILGPLEAHDNDLNEASVVCRLVYGETSFLFTGDASKQSENDLLKKYGAQLSSNVLKLGHHGSDTSSQEKWLNLVDPQLAVACVGAENTYGHPSPKILQRLHDRDITLFRTDLSGTIVLTSDGKSIGVSTEK